jgi:hypothetical protein
MNARVAAALVSAVLAASALAAWRFRLQRSEGELASRGQPSSEARPPKCVPDPASGGGGDVFFMNYAPRTPRSLGELPAGIRRKLEAHLSARLGSEYLARLTFAGGQVIDLEAFRRAEPRWRDYEWEVFSYRLAFRLSDPQRGLAFYDASIELNAAGEVIQEIDLPPVAREAAKGVLFPLEAARAVARGRGLGADCGRVSVEYDRAREALVWVFDEFRPSMVMVGLPGPSPELSILRIRVDAHSGAVVDDRVVRVVR